MSDFARAPLTAILGPTNTGKTHLAVERMAAHSSGMIGFPLRLLAREVYDRVAAMKGANRVALITGEEKIVPKDRKSTRLNSSHANISYAVFCLKKKYEFEYQRTTL